MMKTGRVLAMSRAPFQFPQLQRGNCYTKSMEITTLLTALIVSLVINLSMFLVAFRLQSDKLTDISYAVTFATIGVWGFATSEASFYHLVLMAMVLVWALRLGGFLLYRVVKSGKDARFDGMRENFWKFGRFWLAQAITVWVVMIPSVFAFAATSSIGGLQVAAVAIWLIGLLCESTADFQKLAFSKNPKNKDKWIAIGIWKYSRHPNYFGEILVWAGIYLYALSSLSSLQAVIGLASPLFIITLLLFVSGIPILEKSADKRWGRLAAYREYKRRTSILIPLPRLK
jgi:steroid 5-alpha reductase family enzyme